jgi:hypothetical protein
MLAINFLGMLEPDHEPRQGASIARRLESIIPDAIFGWRQLSKHKTASAAAILSLALGIGASMAAFRLIDALFLRPLPIAHPEQRYQVTYPYLFEGGISLRGEIALGSAIGLGLGLDSEHYIAALLYQVKASDPNLLAWPLASMLGAAVLAALPPVLRAIHIDPATLLRSE